MIRGETSGHGLTQDFARAHSWYVFAAEHGSIFACTRLAKAHSNGELGLTVDQLRAEQYARMGEQADTP